MAVADDVSVGRAVRAVRLSHNLRQSDVAARAGVSRQAISRLERGLVDGMTVRTLRALSRALAMPSVVSLGWRSPELERLTDRVHAALVEEVSLYLETRGWTLSPEHSFNHYGERGSVDILAWHAAHDALLVVEVKTRIWDVQDLLTTMDRKLRLLPGIAARRWGWRATTAGMLLVLPDLSTHRHVIERHAATFRAALPDRQHRARAWLADPAGRLRGIWFLPISHQNDIGTRALRRRASKRGGRGVGRSGRARMSPNHPPEPGPMSRSAPIGPLARFGHQRTLPNDRLM